MKRMEVIAGDIMASFLIAIIIYSVFQSLFVMLFRDGRGLGMYGGRGEFYINE